MFEPLDSFDVTLAPGDPPALLRVDRGLGDPQAWSLYDLRPGDGSTGALAIRGRGHRLAAWYYAQG
jgi:hypothetical protein